MQNQEFTFTDFLDQISLAENSLFAFGQQIQEVMQRTKGADYEAETAIETIDIDKGLAKDKRDLSIMFTYNDLLRVNALAKAFVGVGLGSIIKDFNLKVESYTNPLLKGQGKAIMKVIDYMQGWPVNANAKQVLKENDLLRDCFDSPRIKAYVDDFDNMNGINQKDPYLFNTTYFHRNCFLELIDLRCSIVGALQRMDTTRGSVTIKTLMGEAFRSKHIIPGLAQLDLIIETLYSKSAGSIFSLETLIKGYGFPLPNLMERYNLTRSMRDNTNYSCLSK